MKNTRKIKLNISLMILVTVFSVTAIFSVDVNKAFALTCNSATFTGNVIPNGTIPTYAYFEWGTTENFGNTTQREKIEKNETTNIKAFVDILNPETKYYYRIKIWNDNKENNIFYGETLNFTTPACPVVPPTPDPVITFTPNDITINYNTSTSFRWSTENANTCSASGGANNWAGNRSISGEFSTGNLTSTVIYTLKCSNSNNVETTKSLIINVRPKQDNPAPDPVITFMPDDITINYNTSTSFRWSTENANTCSGDGGVNDSWASNRSKSGEFRTAKLTRTTTYTLTCSNTDGVEKRKDLTINVRSGGSSSGSEVYYAAPNIYTNQAIVEQGRSDAVLRGSVHGNNLSTQAWFEYGTDLNNFEVITVRENYGTGRSDFDFRTIALKTNTRYYFRAVAENSRGRVYGNTLTFVTNNPNSYNPTYSTVYYYPSTSSQTASAASTTTSYTNTNIDVSTATTAPASKIDKSSVKLNGIVNSAANTNTVAWFEWGTSRNNLINSTSKMNIDENSDKRFSSTIAGLNSDTTYYFRAIAENSAWRNRGDILKFTTKSEKLVISVPKGSISSSTSSSSSNVSNPSVSSQKAESIGNNKTSNVDIGSGSRLSNSIKLNINGGAETISSDERRTYQIDWSNKSVETIENVVLTISIPGSVEFENSSSGSFSEDDSAVILDLGTIASNRSGNIAVTVKTKSDLNNNELITLTANLLYTDQSNVQDDVLAYSTQRVVGGKSGLGKGTEALTGAAIFGISGDSFFPKTIIGWLIIIILILLLVLLIKYLLITGVKQSNQVGGHQTH